jgi:RHS repeat-associated protein
MRAVVRVSDGKAVQVMRHGPWGGLELDSVASGFARVPFGFAGGIHDDATKLVRFGAREYDARTGRWLSKDEARFGGGENFYEYAGGDPANRIDLDGRKGLLLCLQIVPYGNVAELAACLLSPTRPFREPQRPQNCEEVWHQTFDACVGAGGGWAQCLKEANAAEEKCRKDWGYGSPKLSCEVPQLPVGAPIPIPVTQ